MKNHFKGLLICFAVFPATKVKAQISFQPAVHYQVRNNPVYIVTGDFDGDGNKDLVTANNNDSVAILIGSGSGTFASSKRFRTGDDPKSLSCGDFNGDGKSDVATANNNWSANSASILLATGSGNLLPSVNYPAGGMAPFSVINDDFNNDGIQDLVIGNTMTSGVSIRLGDGLGGFGSAANFSYSPGSSIVYLASGDLNNDFKADLVISLYSSDSILVMLGNGMGSFSSSTKFSGGGQGVSALVITDFNNDGKKDIAVANYFSLKVSLLLGNGFGSFALPTFFSVGLSPIGIVNADFNGDGKQDIATSNTGSNNVSVLLGNGMGSFTGPFNFPVGTTPRIIVAADFNNDSKIDLATANFGTTSVSVLLNSNSTGFGNLSMSNLNLKIYPNPTTGNFKIEITEKVKCDLIITNSIGQKVHEQEASPGINEINVSQLLKGIYNCILAQNKQTIAIGKLAIE